MGRKKGTYRPRAKKWCDEYVFEMPDPCTHPSFISLCKSGDPDLTGWAEQVRDASTALLQLTYGQIQEGADGCYIKLRDLRAALPKNMPPRCTEIIALISNYAPINQGEQTYYTLPHEGGPSRLILTEPLLWPDAA